MLIIPILIIAYVTKQIIQRAKEIELSLTGIRIKNIQISINQIEKIIIQGYFVQSIGIKQEGRRFVSYPCHFRFRTDEEKHINELKQWAESHAIPVVNGRVYKLV